MIVNYRSKKKKKKKKRRDREGTLRIVDFGVPTDQRDKLKESEKKDKCQDNARELKEYMEHDSDGDTNCNWCTWNNPQMIVTRTRRLKNQMTSRCHLDYSIIKIGQNSGKSLGDLRRGPADWSDRASATTHLAQWGPKWSVLSHVTTLATRSRTAQPPGWSLSQALLVSIQGQQVTSFDVCGALPICWGTVGIFYVPSWLGAMRIR